MNPAASNYSIIKAIWLNKLNNKKGAG